MFFGTKGAKASDIFKLNTAASGPSAQESLDAIYRQQRDDFEQYLQPYLEKLQARTTATDMTDAATRRSAGLLDDYTGQVNRTARRFQAGGGLYSQADTAQATLDAATVDGAVDVNSARRAQSLDQMQARRELMTQGQSLMDMGTQSLSASADMWHQRDQQYRQAKSEYKSGKGGMLGAIAGAAIGTMVPGVGTMLGAQLGAGIGSGMGS